VENLGFGMMDGGEGGGKDLGLTTYKNASPTPIGQSLTLHTPPRKKKKKSRPQRHQYSSIILTYIIYE
jgi:hypothetical protein